MSRDPKETIRSLLRMTVGNGCTVEEARSARNRAEAVAERHGLRVADYEEKAPPPRTEPRFRGGYSMNDVAEAMRRGFGPQFQEKMREARRRAHEEAARKKREQEWASRKFDSVGDCIREYLRPQWRNRQTQKPLTNGEIASLVRHHFPEARTTAKTVASYRCRAKKDGVL
jgi:hypothetical protein